MSGETVTVDRAALEAYVASVKELTARVGQLLDALAPEDVEPDPAAPHPGFQRFRNARGGQRG